MLALEENGGGGTGARDGLMYFYLYLHTHIYVYIKGMEIRIGRVKANWFCGQQKFDRVLRPNMRDTKTRPCKLEHTKYCGNNEAGQEGLRFQ